MSFKLLHTRAARQEGSLLRLSRAPTRWCTMLTMLGGRHLGSVLSLPCPLGPYEVKHERSKVGRRPAHPVHHSEQLISKARVLWLCISAGRIGPLAESSGITVMQRGTDGDFQKHGCNRGLLLAGCACAPRSHTVTGPLFLGNLPASQVHVVI